MNSNIWEPGWRCETCKGSGEVYIRCSQPNCGGNHLMAYTCQDCSGTGRKQDKPQEPRKDG